MCCILCEEPVRSITLGLAAAGIVGVIRGVRKLLPRHAPTAESTQGQNVSASDAVLVDVAP